MPRQYHTATLLRDGTVLVAGGSSSNLVAAAEVYDPNSRTWITTGSMIEARYGDTATLLLDGTVLVTGGIGSTGFPLASAELYNPGSGSWTAAGNLREGRTLHTATLLPDGTVLAVGGSSSGTDGEELASAELFDPSTRTWTETGGMIEARSGHTATLLPAGNVLVVGGFGASGEIVPAVVNLPGLGSAELYDPGRGSWTATGSMIYLRGTHTATLLPEGAVFATGAVLSELYDPNSETWTPAGAMTEIRARHLSTATLLLDGTVLVTGGYGGYGASSGSDVLASAELYDPNIDFWLFAENMGTPRQYHTATLLRDGTVLVAGGGNDGGLVAPTELYDPSSGT